jgi:exodeoxyribonuclease VII large subunit
MSESPLTNAPEWGVSDLSQALKKTVEAAFSHVRLRGEISGYRGPHSSGHVYFSLKDQNAKIDAVIWKGAFLKMRLRPEEGMEVIATGRITTFPGKSSYQIIIEAVEPAGIGALMALLEQRKAKLAAEGLFSAERKKELPFLPRVIGVITSPTGAVIRDILHRVAERFPRDVLVWPVRVQGETSGAEVAAALRGFNALPVQGSIVRPDVIIVARGGGSVEDLWGFNDEEVVRAVAASAIPVISAVGHETDWTLIDLVADYRAPTPTAAAERAVPVRADLVATTSDLRNRLHKAVLRLNESRHQNLRLLLRAIPSAQNSLAFRSQRLDLAGAGLVPALALSLQKSRRRLQDVARHLQRSSPAMRVAQWRGRFDALKNGRVLEHAYTSRCANQRQNWLYVSDRLQRAWTASLRDQSQHITRQLEILNIVGERGKQSFATLLKTRSAQLKFTGQLLNSLGYTSVLKRGFVLVRSEEGVPLRQAAQMKTDQRIKLQFHDGVIHAQSTVAAREEQG